MNAFFIIYTINYVPGKDTLSWASKGTVTYRRSPRDSIDAAGKASRQRLVLVGFDWRQFRRASLHQFLISNALTHHQHIARIHAFSRHIPD